ncbi:MAG: BlaI/MecI/CopY family transcriptional regulator [Proteobacteria bacterium]|jgi:predicted transcriptional regulator|nr:BlaI/MecI/CopY family transcriptional regulator [Pseudomonadota bacterium]
MRQKKDNSLLTEVELEFMNAVWAIGKGTVREVMNNLSPPRELAYTSASTIMRILEQKKFLVSIKTEKSFVYSPTISKADYQSKTLQHLSAKLFNNTPSSLVARLVDDENLSDDALQEIKELLDKRLGTNDT